jgi:hypothetical protein
MAGILRPPHENRSADCEREGGLTAEVTENTEKDTEEKTVHEEHEDTRRKYKILAFSLLRVPQCSSWIELCVFLGALCGSFSFTD